MQRNYFKLVGAHETIFCACSMLVGKIQHEGIIMFYWNKLIVIIILKLNIFIQQGVAFKYSIFLWFWNTILIVYINRFIVCSNLVCIIKLVLCVAFYCLLKFRDPYCRVGFKLQYRCLYSELNSLEYQSYKFYTK